MVPAGTSSVPSPNSKSAMVTVVAPLAAAGSAASDCAHSAAPPAARTTTATAAGIAATGRSSRPAPIRGTNVAASASRPTISAARATAACGDGFIPVSWKPKKPPSVRLTAKATRVLASKPAAARRTSTSRRSTRAIASTAEAMPLSRNDRPMLASEMCRYPSK